MIGGRLAFVLLVLYLALALVGCAPAAPASQPTAAPQSGEVKASGATCTERAVNGLKAMNLPAGTAFSIFAEDLTIKMADVNVEEFKKQTGFELKTMTAPYLDHKTKIMQDVMGKQGIYDIVLLEWRMIGDVYNAGYVAPLDDWVKKYNPELDDMIAPFNQVWSHYDGKTVALPTDGDTWILYYRKDLFDDPKEQAAYKAKYGEDLKPPETWDQFEHIAEFFTRPSEGLYGATEWRAKGVVFGWFFQRLAGLGGQYFLDNMKPGINTPEGIKALEDLKKMNQWMAEDVMSYGYMETVQDFAQGHAAMLNTWPAASKNIANQAESKVIGKVGYGLTPGYMVDGKLNRKTMTVPGLNAIVNADTKKPKEAVYLVAQWLVCPEQLKRANLNLAGNTDVIRESIFNDPDVRSTIPGGGEYLDAQKANIAQGYPEVPLPGFEEYSQALEIEISRYMTGEVATAKEALDKVAAEWERITDKFGREGQAKQYKTYMDAYYGIGQ